jgi:hypothetical protein
MKIISLLLLLFVIVSCKQETATNIQNETINLQDTIIKKHQNRIDKSYEVGLYSKSYSYHWLVNNDTLDLRIYATEYSRDSTLHLNIHHKNPVLFEKVLTQIIGSLPIIHEDFNTSKLKSLYFKSPIYYKDLLNNLTEEYEQKFGEETVDYRRLNEFLLQSKLTVMLNNLLNKMDKEVQAYSIEKFQLLSKENYNSYISNENLTAYPEYSIHGMGIYVRIKEKKE